MEGEEVGRRDGGGRRIQAWEKSELKLSRCSVDDKIIHTFVSFNFFTTMTFVFGVLENVRALVTYNLYVTNCPTRDLAQGL